MLVSMGGLRRARSGLLIAGLVVAASACASIWGFQDGVDLTDGGGDAGADARSADGSSDGTTRDSAAGDAAAEAASDAPGEAAGPCAAACVPVAPSGWQGPLEIFEGVGGPPPPAPPGCAGGYPAVAYDGKASPVAPAATCSCACSAPSGGACSPPLANYFSDTGCTQSCGTTNQAIASTCTVLALGTCPGSARFAIGSSVASGASCTPDAGSQVAPAAWTGNARLCAPSGALATSGCDAGEVCTPLTALPFQPSTYCVARSGMMPCPASYPVQRTYYESGTESRGCTPCTCGAPLGAACTGGTLEANPNSTCQNTPTPFPVPQACTRLNGAQAALISGLTLDAGPCAPDGGQPTGAFAPTTPTTICCTQ